MQFVSIASGSSGNCIFVGSDTTSILVDAGISNKRIEQGLNEIGRKGSELDGIMITHEHSDHVKGLGVLARKQGVPIYGTKETPVSYTHLDVYKRQVFTLVYNGDAAGVQGNNLAVNGQVIHIFQIQGITDGDGVLVEQVINLVLLCLVLHVGHHRIDVYKRQVFSIFY